MSEEQESRQNAPITNSGRRTTQFPTKEGYRVSESFCEFLRCIYYNVEDEEFRNRTFQSFSRHYNHALRHGDYEFAVIYLMILRIILNYEGKKADASISAKTAAGILEQIA